MATKLKTASSLSGDSNQIRYQKALKQINKIITVNNQLREEISQYQQHNTELQSLLQQRQGELERLVEQNQQLEMELSVVVGERGALLAENEGLRRGRCAGCAGRGQAEGRAEESVNRSANRAIGQLQSALESKQGQIRQLRKKIAGLQQASREQSINKVMYTQVIKSDLSNNQLSRKLTIADSYIRTLSNQCADLKGKLIKAERESSLMSLRSNNTGGRERRQSPGYEAGKMNVYYNMQGTSSEQVLRRYRQLEKQNSKLTKNYELVKEQLKNITSLYKKMQKDHDKCSMQIKGYEQLTARQQSIIEQMSNNYNQEIVKMVAEWKKKLHEQRENFSPEKAADNFKTIEALQAENKQLRKKFQLCSIQLTKCFKTLQIYKTKLSECEQECTHLLQQRDELVDRLSRFQGSHREPREKSVHSRASGSRMFDPDRRNSMGDTGHFNS